MTGRIYDRRRWRKLRKRKLYAVPLCEACALLGLTVEATDVDHIVEIRDGGPEFPPLDGLRSYCKAHHSVKTTTGLKFAGFDVNGNPIDPAHPFVQP